METNDDYRFVDSVQRIGITHRPTNTRLRVISSNGKTAMGIVNCPLLVADEPGAWETVGGQLMSDAIETALGKPWSKMRVIYIGIARLGKGEMRTDAGLREQVLEVLISHRHLIPTARKGHYMMMVPHN